MTQTIKKLIRLDLIALSGRQKRMIPVMILLLVIGAAGAILIEPAIMLICMMIISGMFPGLLFRTEESAHSSRVFTVLPVARKEVVSARFLLLTSLLLAVSVISFAVMMLSCRIHIFLTSGFYEEIISVLMSDLTKTLSLRGFYQGMFALVFLFCMGRQAKGLRKYFREGDTAAAEGTLRRIGKKILLPVAVIMLFELVMLLIGMPAFKFIMSVLEGLWSIFMALLKLGNGLVLWLIGVSAGFGLAAYHYTAAVLEYDDKEL